jgi:hypothetical protein
MPLHSVRDKQARQTQGQLAHAFRQEMASAVPAGNPHSPPKRTKLPSSEPNAPDSMNAATRTPEPGFPKACITNQTTRSIESAAGRRPSS